MLKVLFITIQDFNSIPNGGVQGSLRNFHAIRELTGPKNIRVIGLLSSKKEAGVDKIRKWVNFLRGYPTGTSSAVMAQILDESRSYDMVFLDASNYGVIARHLRRNGYIGRVIVYFHNIEYRIALQNAKSRPTGFWKVLIAKYNERLSVLNSDRQVFISRRDEELASKLYRVGAYSIISASLPDRYPGRSNNDKEPGHEAKLHCLFVGSGWWPNVHGINWFLEHVMPNVDVRLTIIGRGIEAGVRIFGENVNLVGTVNDLSVYYEAADVVVCPIFLGGGMKIKVCEALMHGKTILGTKEAFAGFELDFDEVGALCESADDFITKLNALSKRRGYVKFNPYSRKIYLDRYSEMATSKAFRDLFA